MMAPQWRSAALTLALGALLGLLCTQVMQGVMNPPGSRLITSPHVLFTIMLKGALVALAVEAAMRWIGGSPESPSRGMPAESAGFAAGIAAAFLISTGFVCYSAFNGGRSPQPDVILVYGIVAMAAGGLYWLTRKLLRRYGFDW